MNVSATEKILRTMLEIYAYTTGNSISKQLIFQDVENHL